MAVGSGRLDREADRRSLRGLAPGGAQACVHVCLMWISVCRCYDCLLLVLLLSCVVVVLSVLFSPACVHAHHAARHRSNMLAHRCALLSPPLSLSLCDSRGSDQFNRGAVQVVKRHISFSLSLSLSLSRYIYIYIHICCTCVYIYIYCIYTGSQR